MSERALRDELEHLQVEGRDLESELLLEHSPEFLVRRDDLERALGRARAECDELERRVRTASKEHAAAATHVARLAGELQSLEQQRLPVVPLLLLPVAFVAVLSLQSGRFAGLTAFCATASLGLLFGRRILDWAQPGRERRPLAPNLKNEVWRNEGLLALVLSIATALVAAMVVLPFHGSEHMEAALSYPLPEEPHVFFTFPLQALAATSVGLALRARRRAREGGRAGGRTSIYAGAVGLITLGAVAWTWIPELRYLIASRPYVQPGAFLLPLSAFVAMVPLGWALLLQRRPESRSLSALPASLACTAASFFFTFTIVAPFRVTDLAQVGALWAAIQCAGGALILGWDFADRERETLPIERWAGVAAAVVSLAAAGVRCAG